MSWVAGKAMMMSSALRWLLRVEARAKEEAMREMGARGVTGECWAGEGTSWPDVA